MPGKRYDRQFKLSAAKTAAAALIAARRRRS